MNQATILDIGVGIAIIIILVTIGFMSVRVLRVRRRRLHHIESSKTNPEPAVVEKEEKE
jgi:hypothetical protein